MAKAYTTPDHLGRHYSLREMKALEVTHGPLTWIEHGEKMWNDEAYRYVSIPRFILRSDNCDYCGQPTNDISCRFCGAQVQITKKAKRA